MTFLMELDSDLVTKILLLVFRAPISFGEFSVIADLLAIRNTRSGICEEAPTERDWNPKSTG